MKNLKKNIIKILLFFFISLIFLKFSYNDLNLEDFQSLIPELKSNKIFTNLEKINNNKGVITVAGIIHANINDVWNFITNEDRIHKDILEKYILKDKGNTKVKKVLLNFPWPLHDRWTIYEENINSQLYGKEWKEIGGDIPINRGAIRLFKLDVYKTLMIYKSSLDPGLDYVPQWAIDIGMKYYAPSIIKRVQDYFKEKSP